MISGRFCFEETECLFLSAINCGQPVTAPLTRGDILVPGNEASERRSKIKNQQLLGPVQPTDMFYLASRVFKKLTPPRKKKQLKTLR